MILEVFKSLFSFGNIITMFFGMAVGTIIGALPGLTAVMGVAILLPLTFGLPSITGMILLLSVYCGGIYGGSITAILIKTPGTPASAATVYDGYPLAQRGEGGDALYSALLSSTIGGLFSCVMLLFFAPIIARAALRFGPPEYATLALFGLTVISVATSKNAFKGLMMAGIGLLVTMIGIDPIEGIPRFTFGSVHMSAGIYLIPAVLGAFAVAELLEKMANIDVSGDNAIPFKKSKLKSRDVLRYWKTLLRSSIIGTIIGAVPGTGAAISSFLSYNEAKRTAKNPEVFGTGSIEGIVASETANNAVTGATLIPLLTLGIPGDAVTAVMVGALMMQGIIPGPNLFTDGSPWVYIIMGSMFLINIVMFIEGKVFIKFFVHVTKIPVKILLGMLMVLCVVGAFATNNSLFDVGVMLVFGVVCFFMARLDYPVTPLVISLVLGNLAETNLRGSLVISHGSLSIFVTRPLSLVFLIITLALLVSSFVKTIRSEMKAAN